ncbi:mechanosensitive ion channel [Candidatus Falkowbacteria bacterium]|nr:mechanosensitive ion channel [Candidatus Falkowbacteria bacterium]
MWFLNILLSLLVVAITWSLSSWCASFSRRWANRQPKIATFNPTMRLIIQRAAQVLIYIAGFLIIGKIWNIDIRPLWAGLGVAGVAIALGLQETLSNLFAAFFVIIDKTIRVGAYLKLDDGTVAKIEDISWRSTRLKAASGERIIMPNRLFANQKVISCGQTDKDWTVTISAVAGPGGQLDEVEAGALAAGQVVAKKYQAKPILAKFYFEELTAAGLKFSLSIKIDSAANEIVARHELLKNLTIELAKRSCPLVGR